MTLELPAQRLPLDTEGAEDGMRVILGVRPEDFRLDTSSEPMLQAEALNVLPEQEAQIADHILGLILTGISHYDETIHQTALAVLCRDIFGRSQLPMARKHAIFVRLHKKLLTLLSEPRAGQLTFFNCAAMLNHLYRYTVRQELLEGPFRFPPEKPAAFFPGTFDPFSVGHKQIVQEIRARGFEVYLAVDEFSWSKKTLPKLLRRRIVSISVADQWDTYLFPSAAVPGSWLL